MIDQTPDPWKERAYQIAEMREHTGVCPRSERIAALEHDILSLVGTALAAERAQHQQEKDAAWNALHVRDQALLDAQDQLAQRDETIRQLQDAFARCREVQQATAETWRIEHDQMAEQIRLLRGAMAADDERLRRAAEQAGILYVSCDTAEALAEQIACLSAQVRKLEAELALARSAGGRDLNLRMNEANKALRAERDAAQQQIATLTQERDEALKVLAPNMPESGLVDACRQVKQVAVSEAGNSTDWMNRADAAEARCATLTAALDEYDRIDACSPTTPWCDAPGYVNAEHYDGHPAAKRELIAKMRAALSGVPTP